MVDIDKIFDSMPEQLVTALAIITLFLLICMYALYPWYLCKYKKYDLEIKKAQRVSKVFWLKIQPGYAVFFDLRINYEKIRLEILDFMYEELNNDFSAVLDKVRNDNVYLEESSKRKIDLLSSIFDEAYGSRLFEEFHVKYPLVTEFGDYVKEIHNLKGIRQGFKRGVDYLDNNELEEIGLLRYKKELEETC